MTALVHRHSAGRRLHGFDTDSDEWYYGTERFAGPLPPKGGAMGFFDAIGDAVSDGVDTIGDAIEEGADVIENIGDGAGSWIADQACSTGNDVVCGIGSFGGGVFSGSTSWVSGLTRIGGQVGVSFGQALGDSLRGRWGDALHDLGAGLGGLGILAGEVLSGPGRILVDEPLRHWQRNQLRGFVSDRIDETFQDVQQRNAVRAATGVENTPWGMKVTATHRLLAFDSFHVPLDQLHPDSLNLYALAGFERQGGVFEIGDYPQAVVQTLRAEDSVPAIGDRASRDDIDSYLTTGSPGLRVLAMQPRYAARSMAYAKRISKDVGILINWQDSEHELLRVTAGLEDRFPREWFGGPEGDGGTAHRRFLTENGFVEGCEIAAFGAIRTFESGGPNRGVALGLNVVESDGPCVTPGRNDGCCTTVRIGRTSPRDREAVLAASVAYLWPRNATAPWTARFILAHEIGHWLGLCHPGHRRLTEIMYTAKRYSPIKGLATPTVLGRGVQRPRFTGDDGRNLWRFILNQRAGRCFAVVQDPGPE